MDVMEALKNRLEIREYSSEPVDSTVKKEVLEAGRLAPSGKNLQHWRFILVDDEDDVGKLADLSTSGSWVRGADFAIVVLTDPTYSYHKMDAGRAITHMQLAAWDQGVGSCIYTGYDQKGMREFLEIPESYSVTAVIGFGYPVKEIKGKKRRKPLEEIAYRNRFGSELDLD